MKDGKKIVAEIFGVLFGGDNFWNELLFPDKSIEEESIETKRSQFLFVIRPWICSFWFWVFLSCLKYVFDMITVLAANKGQLTWIFESIIFVCNRVNSTVVWIDNTLNDILAPFASFLPYDPFFKFSAIFLYILWYKWLRKRNNQSLISLGRRLQQKFPALQNVLAEIYIELPGNEKIKLSDKWEHVRENLGKIIVINFVVVYFLNLRTNFATRPVWQFALKYIGSFTGFFSFMEAYHYLSLADSAENRRRSNTTLDMVKLRVDYQRYAKEKGISMIHEYRRNYAFLKEEIRIAEEDYIESENPDIAFLYQYLDIKRQLRHMDMAVRLVKGENIFYASPFYKDIDGCIFFRMFQSLLHQEKGLILVEDDGKLERMVEWLEEGLGSVTGLRKLWNVAILKEAIVDVDVGILSLQSIGLGQDMDGLQSFLKEVSFAVVLEASDMLAAGQETITTLAEYVHYGQSKCTWLLCDWNAESMLDLFSHLLCTEFVYVNATPVGANEEVVTYWDIETEPNRIWNPAKRFLGLESGIAEIAGRNQIFCMTWYGERWIPVLDMQWIIGQYYQLYSKKTSQLSNQNKMNDQIQCDVSSISCGIEEEKFLVVEDAGCNLYETGRQYLTRAKEKAYVHILSYNYLLRDFMKTQPKTMNFDPKYIAQFVPEYVNSMRNVYLHLLRQLLTSSVSAREIYDRLKSCEEPPEFVQVPYSRFRAYDAIYAIEEMILNITNQDESHVETAVCYKFLEEKEELVREFSYHISDREIRHNFHKYFRPANYVDETGIKCHINCLMLAGHLGLKYLPGQYVTLNGKYYQVESILDNDETLLTVKRASEHVVDRFFYRQLRDYKFDTGSKTENIAEKLIFSENNIHLIRITADFTSKTIGYLTLKNSWNDFSNAQENGCTLPERKYKGKQVLCVEAPDLKRLDLFYVAAVMHDMFYTLYPKYCHLLSVAVSWKEEEKKERYKYRGVLSELHCQSCLETKDREEYCFYIFEDSCEDMGLIRSIERHFRRILEMAAEYIQWEKESKSPLYFS